MAIQNTRLGAWLMLMTTVIFATQDGFSRYLAQFYSPLQIVTIRYWVFGLFVVLLALRNKGGLALVLGTRHRGLHILRGLFLAGQICCVLYSFAVIGLVHTHAILAVYPLMVAALSVPILGERVGWRRWLAILMGLCGVLVILQPGVGAFEPQALVMLLAAVMFALYGILTRYVGRDDGAGVSLFWAGIVGAVAMTPLGLSVWQPMAGEHMISMFVICCTSILSHFLLIKAYEVAEASAIQPLSYLQLVHVSLIGILIFDESIALNVIIGASIVVASGIFTILRTAKVAKTA